MFVLVNKASEPNTSSAELFLHQTGDFWYKGRSLLQGQSEKQTDFDHKNAATYTAWDGDTLYLTDGRMLKAMDKTE